MIAWQGRCKRDIFSSESYRCRIRKSMVGHTPRNVHTKGKRINRTLVRHAGSQHTKRGKIISPTRAKIGGHMLTRAFLTDTPLRLRNNFQICLECSYQVEYFYHSVRVCLAHLVVSRVVRSMFLKLVFEGKEGRKEGRKAVAVAVIFVFLGEKGAHQIKLTQHRSVFRTMCTCTPVWTSSRLMLNIKKVVCLCVPMRA